jgi:hypothetical protein
MSKYINRSAEAEVIRFAVHGHFLLDKSFVPVYPGRLCAGRGKLSWYWVRYSLSYLPSGAGSTGSKWWVPGRGKWWGAWERLWKVLGA